MDCPSDRVLRLRGILADLHTLTRGLDKADEQECIAAGWELWRIITKAQEGVEVVKEHLRENVGDTPGHFTLTGPGKVSCTVHVPEARPVMRQGIDVEGLALALGPDFGRLFCVKTQVKPRPDFGDEVVKLPPEKAQTALDAVDIQTGKPRISFA